MGYVSIAFAVVSFVLTAFTLPESPRFLVSKGQYDSVVEILEVIQRTNGSANKNLHLKPQMIVEAKDESSDMDDKYIDENLNITEGKEA